jgi:2-polyprenyl-6-methoxyphenol hydroxylase-like FAD-dependent oxidoreductase
MEDPTMTTVLEPRAPTALLIGGGIAGPVVAMFLRRAGLDPVIFEGRPEPVDEAGAFLNLAPNGLAVLETLGIAGAVSAAGTPTKAIEFLNHRGRRLGRFPETTLLIRRGALQRALREAALAEGTRIEYGKRLVGIDFQAGRTVVRFADGTWRRGDLVIGCDGVHSATRRAILPDARAPEYTGVVDSGGFAAADVAQADGVMRMIFGRRGFFGWQVTPSGEAFWFENLHRRTPPERGRITDEGWREHLLALHDGDPTPIAGCIRGTPGPIGRWPIYDLPTLPTWHRGAVCLVGDAAHATSPHAGQGASLALEDAIVLARCLRDCADVETAFSRFEEERRPRVEKLVREARRTGKRKAAGNPVSRRIRDLLLPFFLKMGMQGLREVYRYRVEWEGRAA